MSATRPVGTVALALGPNDYEAQLVRQLLLAVPPGNVHRCLDVVDLAARSQLGEFDLIVVDANFPRLAASVVSALPDNVRTLGLCNSHQDRQRLTALGVVDIVTVDSVDIDATVTQIIGSCQSDSRSQGAAHPQLPARTNAMSRGLDGGDSSGRLTAVWGAPGSPGRTMIATTLSQSLAGAGMSTFLIDADTTTHGLSAYLALEEEPSGLIAAVHHAERGELDAVSLVRLGRQLDDRLRILTGIPHVSRRYEIRPSAAKQLWATARTMCDHVVVDTGHLLDDLGLHSSDDVGMGEPVHAAGVSAIAACDVIVAVTGCEPAAIARMLSHLPSVRTIQPLATLVVAVNRVRRPVVSSNAAQTELVEFLREQTGADQIVMVDDDRKVHDAAVVRGVTPFEYARSASSVSAVADLARVGLAATA